MLSEALHRRIHWVLIVVLAFLLPFCMYQKVRFTGIAIILLAANMLLSGLWRKATWQQLGIYSSAILGLILLSGIGFFYSENVKSAGQLLESRVILLALPLVFWVMGKPDKKLIDALLWAVYAGVLLSTIIIFREGIVPFTDLEMNKGCYSCVMELLIPMHRPYYGLLMIISIAFSFSKFNQIGTTGKIGVIIVALYIAFLLWLMLPKMILISAVLGVAILVTKKFYTLATGFKKVIWQSAIVGILVSIVGGIALLSNTEEKSSNTLQSSVVSRKLLWEASAHTLTDPITFLLGVGLGDESDKLSDYILSNYPAQFEKSLNAHNQYLAEWIKFGLLGLVSILIIGCYPVYIAWKNSNYLSLFIAVVWALNLLTENYLNREAGLLTLAVIILPTVYLEKKQVQNQ